MHKPTKDLPFPGGVGRPDKPFDDAKSCVDGSNEIVVDVEAQRHVEGSSTSPLDHEEVSRSKALYLTIWLLLNLAVTISNKAILGQAPFPWLLTALHASATSLGCCAMLGTGSLELSRLGYREHLILVAFSFLFTLNIAVSNVSLAAVSVPLHQIMRSTCPVVTILIYRGFYGREYSTATYLSMIPLVLGVGLATAGDYSCSPVGFLLTIIGVILASVKTIMTNRLMTGSLALSASELLFRLSPLAALQCIVFALLSGEAQSFRLAYLEGEIYRSFRMALLANAVVAFALNWVSFKTNKVVGAVAMTVAGNVKQVMTIGLGIVLFSVRTGLLNAVGMAITIAGALWYSKIELDKNKTSSWSRLP